MLTSILKNQNIERTYKGCLLCLSDYLKETRYISEIMESCAGGKSHSLKSSIGIGDDEFLLQKSLEESLPFQLQLNFDSSKSWGPILQV